MSRFRTQTARLHAPNHEILGRSRVTVCSFPLSLCCLISPLSYLVIYTHLFEHVIICFTLSRKVQKRSHTLRYTLKNRGTGEVLFVVLFTLYLKEDVDENGRVKDGVEGGKPFELMDKDLAAKHNAKKNGEEVNGEDVKKIEEGVEKVQLKENEKSPVQETSEDDVD